MLQYGWTLKNIILSEVGAEYIMRNARLDEAQAGIKTAGRNINNFICRWQALTKEPLEGERGEWKSWLKTQHSKTEDHHGIQSHHFMANRWGNNRNSGRFILGGSKITADGDCSHEIKRRLLFGRKAKTNLDSILKSRDITLPTKVHRVRAMVFLVWMWKWDHIESWAPKNWCFWTVV